MGIKVLFHGRADKPWLLNRIPSKKIKALRNKKTYISDNRVTKKSIKMFIEKLFNKK